MVDREFSEPILAELYDEFCAGRPDFAFYLPLVMSAQSVLDVGCGTGELLRLARQQGHTGRLCGLDPAEAMLQVGRRRTDVEWLLSDLSTFEWDREFDLIVMTGHAFQVFLDDEELRSSLAAVHTALTDGGRFVFETRNPLAREWDNWTPDNVVEINHSGTVIRMTHLEKPEIDGEFLTFTLVYSSPDWDQSEGSQSTLRFLDPGSLSSFLSDAGLAIEAQYGDWDRSRLTQASPEIITVAMRA